jgi:CxxC motif-containing protein (DUF1111 family)
MFRIFRTLSLTLSCIALSPFIAVAQQTADIVPLFDASTKLEPDAIQETEDALITRVGDRVRDRHAREAQFKAYDHYLTWYWEHRTVGIEVVDKVAKGGTEVTFNITSLWPLNTPDFRAFYVGKNTVAEYAYNVDSKKIDDTHYTATVKSNALEKRPLKAGDVIEIEFSPFLLKPPNGRANYYGTAMLYVVGQGGMVAWHGVGDRLSPQPLPQSAWLGGRTTLPYQYSNEPLERFKQMATNIAPENAQPFMLGRRLHHTDFETGAHSERGNPAYEEHAGKLGPQFVARSCVACHVNNGRALPPEIGKPMFQSVVKVGANANGLQHDQLGTALQPQVSIASTKPEASVSIRDYTEIAGKYADGTEYSLRKPSYEFTGIVPEFFSVRLTPQLVGLGLLEAVSESTILSLADSDDSNHDGISGRARVVRDPQTQQSRLGRFGYKASQPKLIHQIAGALNSDMGVTTSVFPQLDGVSADNNSAPELDDADLDHMYRYVATLGVGARRKLDDPMAVRGEELFAKAECVKCHVPSMTTGSHHPLAELRLQTIQPFTDLLLHDMGTGLADSLGEGEATGAEWRTAPLWGIGFTSDVSQAEAYLHDGRARTLEEAILWHGGEAEASKESFRKMPLMDRTALISFLKSL